MDEDELTEGYKANEGFRREKVEGLLDRVFDCIEFVLG
jgi:hypothetical protein